MRCCRCRCLESTALPSLSTWGFIREAWLLTTVSVIIDCIIWFQFATTKGLCDLFASQNPAVQLWFDSFVTHFFVVSLFVSLLYYATFSLVPSTQLGACAEVR